MCSAPDNWRVSTHQVLNTQRSKVYSDRRRALVSETLDNVMVEYAEKTVDDILEVMLQNVSAECLALVISSGAEFC